MECRILKPFNFSEDGVTPKEARAGAIVDVPDVLVSGLEAEGYLTPDAPQNLPDIAELRRDYERLLGKRPFNGWDAETLIEKMKA